MRILLISHTCQSITEGQPKAHALAALADVTLRVLVPDRWHRYGQWRSAQPPERATFEYQVAKVRLPWAGPAQTYLHSYPCLAGVLRQFQPDVIDLWEEPWSLVSVQACRLRRKILPRARIVSETEQNIDKHLPFPFERFRSYTLANADFAVGRSTEAVEVIRRKGFRGPAETVPNGVDAELFRPMDRENCRRQLGLSGFVVGYVGRMVEEKGVLDLLHAVRLCPADVNMIAAGDGPLRRQLADSLDRIRVLPALPLAELPSLMNAMDVLVLSSQTTKSWKEQFGRVVIEAHACGTPVIGSNSGAIAEVVGAGGLVVPEKNPPALAAAIMQLRDDPLRRQKLGEAGRGQALAHCTWERVAQRMHDIYRRVLSSEVEPVGI
jgi:glycosyltransferase involved in cell wall biosynthesis